MDFIGSFTNEMELEQHFHVKEMQEWGKRRKTGAKCAVHKDENCFSMRSDLSSRRLCAEKYVTAMCLLYQAVM